MSEGNNVMRDLGYSGETQLDSNVPHYALRIIRLWRIVRSKNLGA